MAKKNPNEMSFLDHLEELRGHLIKATLAVLIFASVAFICKDIVFKTILFGPAKVDFVTYN
jgi:sec-independent protein translocase protein TatC